VSWLNFLYEFELGGILADEMGLGKTVQTLAFFQSLKDKRGKKKGAKKPILIVAPTSVITNWSYEIKKFTPEMSSIMLHGPGRKALFEQIPDTDIVLTSYALLRVDRYDLERYEFSHIVLDEAQNIKNPQAATTKAAKAIRARHRLALTGTPTENRPMELWSIMDFLMPGYLGSYEFFRANIERPILEGGTSVQVAQLLNGKTRPFILRRLKADVEKELPPKIESVLHVDMTPSQRQMYAQILNEVRPKVFDAIKKKGVAGASVSILAALLRLRQVCNHPNSIEAFEDLAGYDSGKFNLLKDLTIEALESGRKILLFSQFRGMLNIIRTWLDEQQTKYLYLDGATRNRQELIDQFSQDESVRLFLISLKAGGAGLNLMAADTVIIYDPWWNPAVESQAVDRAHRIGQNKTVSVYRLVTEDSVEQKIMALKEKKSKLVDALVNENGLSTLKLAKADLENLFSPLPEIE
jgi:non-specific serine/threonine protein kinase